MSVIGIDPSLTATGVCRDEPFVIRYPKGISGDDRLAVIFDRVSEQLWSIDLAVIEDLPTHAHGAGKTGMVQGVIRLALQHAGIPTVTVPPASLKTFATGKGNATKPDMRMALYRRYGLDIRDDNEADAWFLREIGRHHLGVPTVGLPQTHLRALDKIEWPPTGEAA